MTTVGAKALKGRGILDLGTATTVGIVDSAVIDAEDGGLAYLVLKKTPGSATLLPWTAIHAVGPDAITIGSGDDLVVAHGPGQERAASGDLDPVGKLLLTERGEALGTIDDVVVDTDTGVITAFGVDGAVRDDLVVLGSGAYAVVVRVG